MNRIIQNKVESTTNYKYVFSVITIYMNNIEGLIYSAISAIGIRLNKKFKKIFVKSFSPDKYKEINQISTISKEDFLNETKEFNYGDKEI